MIQIMTSTSSPTQCTPADILANLPGILGFYPRESIVFATFNQTSISHRFQLGPVLRIDLAEHRELIPEVGASLAAVEPDLIFAFVITERGSETANEVAYHLWEQAEEGAIDIQACWFVAQILTGEEFQLAFGPSPEQLTDAVQHPKFWERGQISPVAKAPAMGPLLRTGDLPQLSRAEAYDYFNRFNPNLEAGEITALESFATRYAAELSARIEQEAQHGGGMVLGGIIADFGNLLDEVETAALNGATLLADDEVLATVAVYLSDSLLRDAVLDRALQKPAAAMTLSLAVARTFSGKARANALCLYAVAAVAAELSMRVVPALSSALRAVPGHTLSTLLLDGAQVGAFQPILEATRRGSELVAEKYHVHSFRVTGSVGETTLDAA